MRTIADGIQWAFLGYFVALNAGYLTLNILSFVSLWRCMQRRVLEDLPQVFSDLQTPISLVVPAFNEEATIVASVRSLLQLNYPEYEILVINNGSRDGTVDVLRREFSLVQVPDVFRVRVATKRVRAVYQSLAYPELRVIDKENGGKADALNAGINASRYPLYCGLDADSVLQRDSLHRVALAFLEDPRTVACGGIIRIANGCRVSGGFLTHAGLPRRPIALVQVVEYLRAFLFGRLGWSPLNAVLVISGAFGLFDKETVISVGGYRTGSLGEDMELIVRLHRVLSAQGRPYRIAFVPDPVCWTEAPESWRVLRDQRIRWQRGLAESLSLNRRLLFSRRGGAAGWVAFPFALLFECASPVMELVGYAFFAVGVAFGFVSLTFAAAFLVVAIGLGILLSVTALLLEEVSFHIYPRVTELVALLLVAVAENFGYRQITTYWRLLGIWRWVTGRQARWGTMTRTASWQREAMELKR
jgi:cellulose synthase/poly-beta-1,6-N-acetylglucosamine synthase-like glycosyltransferase